MQIGLEALTEKQPDYLHAARIALLTHQGAINASFQQAHDVISELYPGQLRALFSPQHGLWGADQDNMVETAHTFDAHLQIPVYSLYSGCRQPLPSMFDGVDYFLIDLQDVGTRVYTYIWTVSYCLEVCARQGLPVVILDRPNPLGGELVEGTRLRTKFASFVGRAAIPMRYGLTLAEMACYLNAVLACGAEINVVRMVGWQRAQDFSAIGRTWLPPSPNLPRFEGVLTYPGLVLLEGTNLSEGRGTTTPFEVLGAPFIDPWRLREEVMRWNLPGVCFRPVQFKPTFQKWQDRDCAGLFLHVVDKVTFRPYRTAVVLIDAIRRLYPAEFQWLQPPFEYEEDLQPIDILSGGDDLRLTIEAGLTPASLHELCEVNEEEWWDEVRPFLLY